jgi:hypothetical protein
MFLCFICQTSSDLEGNHLISINMVAIPVQGKEGGFSKKIGRTSETFSIGGIPLCHEISWGSGTEGACAFHCVETGETSFQTFLWISFCQWIPIWLHLYSLDIAWVNC